MTLVAGDFLAVWLFLGVNILSPGPNVINSIATAMGGGRVAGLGSALGVGLGIGGWCLAMSLGMGAVFAALPQARVVLTLVALALLGLFARRYFAAALAGWRGRRLGMPAALQVMGLRAALVRSLGVNALNPKALTTWITILAIFPLARAGPADIAVLCAGACLLSFTIHAGYALAFSTPTAARFYLRWGWAISGAAGCFFIAVGVKLALGLVAGFGHSPG